MQREAPASSTTRYMWADRRTVSRPLARTRKRQAFINPEDERSDDVESPALSIMPLEPWDRVKSRQATLARAAKPRNKMAALSFCPISADRQNDLR